MPFRSKLKSEPDVPLYGRRIIIAKYSYSIIITNISCAVGVSSSFTTFTAIDVDTAEIKTRN